MPCPFGPSNELVLLLLLQFIKGYEGGIIDHWMKTFLRKNQKSCNKQHGIIANQEKDLMQAEGNEQRI